MSDIIKTLRDAYSGKIAGTQGSLSWVFLLDAANEIERLEGLLEGLRLQLIEYTNPGIDMDEVKFYRRVGRMPTPAELADVKEKNAENVTQP